MNVTFTGARFEIKPDDLSSEKLLVKSGWILDPRKSLVYTRLPEVVARTNIVVDQETNLRLKRHAMNIAFSHATGGNGYKYPIPNGLHYLDFQNIGIAYAEHRKYTLNADEPGLGKTIQAVGLINALPWIKSVLIVCPALIRLNWARELSQWLVRNMHIGIADPDYLPETNIVIVNYDILGRLRPLIDQRHWDLIIGDEIHMCKNGDAKRTQAFFGRFERRRRKTPIIQAEKYLYLTGTPMVNEPADMWELVQACDENGLGSAFTHYAKRYCAAWMAPWGFDWSGAQNLEELQNSLRGSFMIRRKKSEVLKQLPPKRRQIVVIPEEGEQRELIRRERDLFESNSIKMEDALRRAETTQLLGDETSYRKAAKGLINLDLGEGSIFEQLAKMRHDVALAKIPYIIPYTEMMLEEHNKVVLFGHHLDGIGLLQQAFAKKYKAVVITGEVDDKERDNAVQLFQNDPKCRVCICGITIAVGITITAGTLGLIYELDWRPTVLTQAEDRLHRIGQLYSVLIQHVVFENSVDARMVHRIIKKQIDIDQALG